MTRRSFHPGVLLFTVFALLSFSPDRASAQTDGVFADFTTSMGSFTCRVEYVKAPKASANFIGLATGERAWLDLTSGLVRTDPFYDGQIFHRVIEGFMNQSGSPNGMGTDGPGYAFLDEFDPTLRHDGFGVLSMANSGPDSNGSQFFVTAAPTPWLDDVHTVFGAVVGGSNVVYEINNVETDVNDRPLTNVVLQSVQIRREGAAAQAFDIHAQGLPVVTGLFLDIAKGPGEVSLSFSNQLYADNRLYSSSNLVDWLEERIGIEITPPDANEVHRTTTESSQFFRMAQVQYASSTLAPKDLYGRTLTLTFAPGGPGVITITFDSMGGGTYTWSGGDPGTVTSYEWSQEPYRGQLYPIILSGIVPMTLRLDFTSTTAGTMSGTAYLSPDPVPVSGSFTLTEP